VHAQGSWLGAARSSWLRNRGVNGSALLLVEPVGLSQLQDCSFDSNQQRPGERATMCIRCVSGFFQMLGC
jgi:hypothetical protein